MMQVTTPKGSVAAQARNVLWMNGRPYNAPFLVAQRRVAGPGSSVGTRKAVGIRVVVTEDFQKAFDLHDLPPAFGHMSRPAFGVMADGTVAQFYDPFCRGTELESGAVAVVIALSGDPSNLMVQRATELCAELQRRLPYLEEVVGLAPEKPKGPTQEKPKAECHKEPKVTAMTDDFDSLGYVTATKRRR